MISLQYQFFSMEEWAAYPKDEFKPAIRAWCERHGFMQHVEIGHSVPCKLPYYSKDGMMYCATDFLERVEQRKARQVKFAKNKNVPAL